MYKSDLGLLALFVILFLFRGRLVRQIIFFHSESTKFDSFERDVSIIPAAFNVNHLLPSPWNLKYFHSGSRESVSHCSTFQSCSIFSAPSIVSIVSHDFAASKVQQQNEVSVVLSTIERIRLNKSLLVKSYEKAVLLPNSLNDEDGYIYHSEKNKDCQIGCH